MQTDRKPFYKNPLFWQILLIVVFVLAAVIFLCIALRDVISPPPPPPVETTAPFVQAPPEENPYDALDFAIDESGYLTCTTGESILGVDVSAWQETVDWQQVKAAGMDFAIVRIGGRGTTQGALYPDSYLQANYDGARAAGMMVGGYFFSQAITPEEAVEEANYVLELIQGMEMDMPIVYDWEYVDEESRTANLDARTLTDCTLAFCRTIEAAGYDAMIYFNKDQSHKQMFLDELTQYPFWLASYTTQLDYPYKIDMWQYTNEGTVPGISGNADINLFLKYE